MNSLTTELVEQLFDDVSTIHEAFMRGVRISGTEHEFSRCCQLGFQPNVIIASLLPLVSQGFTDFDNGSLVQLLSL